MSWIERMRQAPPERKERIIWISAGVAAILLVAIWVFTARYQKKVESDTSIIETFNTGVRDFKENYNKPVR
jgi:hypothetical protein